MPQRHSNRDETAPRAPDRRLGYQLHLAEVVLPAWQDYLSAEHRLTMAVKLGDEAARRRQSFAVMRYGAAATLLLHHFADVILRARPAFLPEDVRSVADIQEWLTGYCTYLRSDRIAADVLLLADVAEALKHMPLTRIVRQAEPRGEDILVVGPGGDDLPAGEGKVDEIDQVIIQARSGPRALTAVLQNVVDAWRRSAGMPVPEIGLP